MKNSAAGRFVATVLVAMCVLSAAALRPVLPHVRYAVKIRPGQPRGEVPTVWADVASGDDDVLQESRSDASGFETKVVAVATRVQPRAIRPNYPALPGREPMRVPRACRHACRRASSGDDPPA